MIYQYVNFYICMNNKGGDVASDIISPNKPALILLNDDGVG